MPSVKNIIRKQKLQFQYNGKADGFALQKEVSDWCTASLIPEIEQQLDLFNLDDQYISIDKLEIDATVDKKDWQQKIRNELQLNLKLQLQKYKPLAAEKGIKAVAVLRKLDELILFYFEKGYLPWWSKTVMEDNFEVMLLNWVHEVKTDSRKEGIRELLQRIISKTVVERIVNLLSLQHLFQLLKNLYQQEAELIGTVEVFFKEIMKGGISAEKQKLILHPVFEFVLAAIIKNDGKINTDAMLRLFYEEVKKQKNMLQIFKAISVETGEITNPVKKVWQQLLINENKPEAKKADGSLKKMDKLKYNKLKYNKLIDTLTENGKTEIKKDMAAEDAKEGIYIENAGAVIIAVFLPALFHKLKLVKDGAMVDPVMAALLIQYAVSGKTNMDEYELVLPKILCGLDIELRVDTDMKISTAQKKEVDEMLSAIIEYWAVIKNTSIDGLRESFLKRIGKLTMKENEWLLQVEQKSYDMLLQQLPWSISMIKLPWMKGLLKTEWV